MLCKSTLFLSFCLHIYNENIKKAFIIDVNQKPCSYTRKASIQDCEKNTDKTTKNYIFLIIYKEKSVYLQDIKEKRNYY